jgi:sporulation protein YlmC with PRC-barrel domain
MHLYRTVLASLAIPLAVASVSLGQAAQPADPGMQKDVASQAKQETSVPIRASKLIGMDVYNHQNQHLGAIKDVVLDQTGTNVGYAVVAYGGVLGVGDKLFAIPYRSLEYSSVKDSRIYLSLDEQAIRNAPGFNKDVWPDKAASAEYFKQADQYYDKNGMARPAAGRIEGVAPTLAPAAAPVTPAPVTEGLTWSRRLTSLLGTDVQSPTGESLGDVKDVILDWKTGKVQYDVLSFGGVLGIGDKLFAVPPAALKSKTDAKELVLGIDQQRLKDAPGFDKDNWPNFTDAQWQKTNDQFYTPQPAMTSPDAK